MSAKIAIIYQKENCEGRLSIYFLLSKIVFCKKSYKSQDVEKYVKINKQVLRKRELIQSLIKKFSIHRW